MKVKIAAIGISRNAADIRERLAFWCVSAVSIRCTMSWSVPNIAIFSIVAPNTAEKIV